MRQILNVFAATPRAGSLVAIVRYLIIILFVPGFAASAHAGPASEHGTASLWILHTNDIHDHLRPGYDGVGGLPFVSGYIRDVKESMTNVMVLDAGDVAEKGDLFARKTGSEIVFKALSRIGYHAWTPGNHDHDFGIEALHRFTELAEMDILCINLLKKDGTPEFHPSKIYTMEGLRVGVIGAIEPRRERSLNLKETAAAMAEEAIRIKADTDVILGLVHISSRDAATISAVAPDIDVFITGHSHERLREPILVPGTGALIVQAGSNANYVGRLELEINTSVRSIQSYHYELVKMDHKAIPPDLEMAEWLRQEEMELAPEALEIIGWAPHVIGYAETGILAAEALRIASRSDIALHKTAHIVRATLPAGLIDVNALYRTGGERGHHLVEVVLTGEEVNNYIQGLLMNRWLPTQWSGFHGAFKNGVFSSDLEPDKTYRVVMPEREWRQRFQNLFQRVVKDPGNWPGISAPARELEAHPLDITWTDAMTHLLRKLNKENKTLVDAVSEMAKKTGQHFLLGVTYDGVYQE